MTRLHGRKRGHPAGVIIPIVILALCIPALGPGGYWTLSRVGFDPGMGDAFRVKRCKGPASSN